MPQHSPSASHRTLSPSQEAHTSESTDLIHHDLDDLHIEPPSSGINVRAGRRSPAVRPVFGGNKRLGKGKYKSRPRVEGDIDGECYLLRLPEDVLQVLLARIPPRSLLALSATCRYLHDELQDDLVWKHSYVNRYIGENASATLIGRQAVRTLVQGCQGQGLPGRGWKKEGLAREAMLERWIGSKQAMVVHHPQTDLIDAISLSYPPFAPPAAPQLVVGKNHPTTLATPSRPSAASSEIPPHTAGSPDPSANGSESVATPSPKTPKMTHRQKYEALLAATTRPAPYLLSVSLASSAVVRSDPLSGKVSKGFWGPGQNANLHLRPSLDFIHEPSALHIPERQQSHVLWGMSTGNVVHTSILSRQHTATGARAMSVNTTASLEDKHDDRVLDIWGEQGSSGADFVSASQDGTVKLWRLHPGRNLTKSGKRTPNSAESVPARLECTWTSPPAGAPFADRSDAVRFHQSLRPDPIIVARRSSNHGIVCGITEDGDLRIWHGLGRDGTEHDMREIRIDTGASEVHGAVRGMELEVRESADSASTLSILVLRKGSHAFQRYTTRLAIEVEDEQETHTRQYSLPAQCGPISTMKAFLQSSPPMVPAPKAPDIPGLRGEQPADVHSDCEYLATPSTSATAPSSGRITPTDLELPPADSSRPSAELESEFGRFVLTGETTGIVGIFAWDDVSAPDVEARPIRCWQASKSKITSLDYSCGLIAVGSCDGFIKVYDPLPDPPELLRTFHPSHVSEADLAVASSDSLAGRYYTPNNIVLENDMVAASIGRKVFAWKAGTGKGREKGKGSGKKPESKKASGSARPGKGGVQTLDMKALHRHAEAEHQEIQETNAVYKVPNVREVQERVAMDELGLGDGDEALQYALMLSMEQPVPVDQGELVFGGGRIGGPSSRRSRLAEAPSSSDTRSATTSRVVDAYQADEGFEDDMAAANDYDSEEEALRAVEEFQRQEAREMQEVMAMIERAEASNPL